MQGGVLAEVFQVFGAVGAGACREVGLYAPEVRGNRLHGVHLHALQFTLQVAPGDGIAVVQRGAAVAGVHIEVGGRDGSHVAKVQAGMLWRVESADILLPPVDEIVRATAVEALLGFWCERKSAAAATAAGVLRTPLEEAVE